MTKYERDFERSEQERIEEMKSQLSLLQDFVNHAGYEMMMKKLDDEMTLAIKSISESCDSNKILKLSGKVEAITFYRRYAEDLIKAYRMSLGEA